MSNKKFPISKVFLELSHGILLLFFCIVHKSCLCTKLQTWMSKESHLNFSLNTHFFLTNISSANPYFLVCHFLLLSYRQCFSAHLITQCVTSSWFFLTYTFLVWIISFLHIIFFLRQFNHCLTGNAFYHIQHIITNAICQWLIPQQPNKTTPPMSVNVSTLLTLLPPSRQAIPSLATHCSPLAAQCWCWSSPLDTW